MYGPPVFSEAMHGVAFKCLPIIYLHLHHDLGNAVLAFAYAGLAVVKPDDFSIADSALGKSSVASVTTARVTQFSEVSLVNNSSYCLGHF